MMSKMIVLLIGMASGLHRSTGMLCFDCVDVIANLSAVNTVPSFRSFVKDFEKLRTKECVNSKTNGANTELPSCNTASDQQCGKIIGDIVLQQAYFKLNISAKVTIRGCLDVDNRTEAGCSTDLNMINKQRKIIVKFLDKKISALKMQTGNFTEGEICTYSSFKAGVTKESQEAPNKSSPTATGYGKNGYTILRFQFILTLCTLFVYYTVL